MRERARGEYNGVAGLIIRLHSMSPFPRWIFPVARILCSCGEFGSRCWGPQETPSLLVYLGLLQ